MGTWNIQILKAFRQWLPPERGSASSFFHCLPCRELVVMTVATGRAGALDIIGLCSSHLQAVWALVAASVWQVPGTQRSFHLSHSGLAVRLSSDVLILCQLSGSTFIAPCAQYLDKYQLSNGSTWFMYRCDLSLPGLPYRFSLGKH